VVARGDRDQRTLEIDVTGPANRRRDALTAIVSRLKVVHDLNPEISPDARVPLPDDPSIDVSHGHLLDLEAKHGSDYQWAPERAGGREYRVGDLLQGLNVDLRTAPVTQPATPTSHSSQRERNWARTTLVASVLAMTAAAIVILTGFVADRPQVAIGLAAVFLVGAITAAVVWRRDPERVYHRWVSYCLSAGLGIQALGFSLDAYANNPDARDDAIASVGLTWNSSTGIAISVAWAAVMIALIAAAVLHDRAKVDP
jgi:hypothetical protein